MTSVGDYFRRPSRSSGAWSAPAGYELAVRRPAHRGGHGADASSPAASGRSRRPSRCSPTASPTWCRWSARTSPTPTSCARRARAAPHEVRPCIACNQALHRRRLSAAAADGLRGQPGRRLRGDAVGGADRAGRRAAARARRRRRAGRARGGARRRALRGHDVTLVEASLGAGRRAGRRPPGARATRCSATSSTGSSGEVAARRRRGRARHAPVGRRRPRRGRRRGHRRHGLARRGMDGFQPARPVRAGAGVEQPHVLSVARSCSPAACRTAPRRRSCSTPSATSRRSPPPSTSSTTGSP